MSRLSMSQRGHCYILCVIDEVTNYLVTAPIYQVKSEEIGDALIENVISKFGTPEYIIMDQNSAFMSSLMNCLFKRLGIKIKTVGPYTINPYGQNMGLSHCSTILAKHPRGQGQNWNKLLCLATFAYSTFNTPNLCSHSPFELKFGRQPKILLDLETDPNIKVSGTYQDYYTLLNKTLHYLQNVLQNFQSK